MGADLLHHRHFVGDDHHGDAQPLVDVLDQLQDIPGGLGIQRGGGLVAQQDLGVGGQGRGRWRCAASGRRRAGPGRRPPCRAGPRCPAAPGRAFRASARLHSGDLHGEADVFQAGALHEQVELLEDHADGAALTDAAPCGVHGAQILAVNDHLTGGGPLQQVDAAHQGGLARAAHADDAEDVAVLEWSG